MRLQAHRAYLGYVLRHKREVYRAGRKVGVGRLQLIRHDLSKLGPSEWAPYVRWFNERPTGATALEAARIAFDRAWLHHQHANPHHWQHWVLREDDGATKALPMPDRYVREMVADWRGAGMALRFPDTLGWYEANRARIVLAETTRGEVERLLRVVVS